MVLQAALFAQGLLDFVQQLHGVLEGERFCAVLGRQVGLVDDARPSVTVLDHEYGSAARGDVIDLGESRYTVTRVAANGLGQTELFLESVE